MRGVETQSLTPAAGPHLGGSNLEIRIAEPLYPPAMDDIDALSASIIDGAAFPNRVTLQTPGFVPRCRFGSMVVEAELASEFQYQCTAPSAAEAGASMSLQLRTSTSLLSALSFGGYG